MPAFAPHVPQKFGAWGPVPPNYRSNPYSQQSYNQPQQAYGHQPFDPYSHQAVGADVITTLWVGDLPGETSDQDLLNGFMMFGEVLGASVSKRPAASGARSGFVRFASRYAANSALQSAVSGLIVVLGIPVTCQWAKSNTTGGLSGTIGAIGVPAQQYGQVGAISRGAAPGRGRPPIATAITEELATIWVGNLPDGTSDIELAGIFAPFGQVVGASVHTRPSPMGSYSGFVRFALRHQATQALSVCSSGQVSIQNSQIVAQWAKTNSKVDQTYSPAPQFQDPGYDVGHQAAFATSGAIPPHDSIVGVNPNASIPGSVRTLFIGSLPFHATEADVSQALAGFHIEGAVTLNKPSTRGGSGFIRFDDPQAAHHALLFLTENPIEMDGQELVFKWAKSDTFRTN